MKPLNILVIGAGAYVCGRGTSGFGTILPSLAECHRDGLVNMVTVASTSAESAAALRSKWTDLDAKLQTGTAVQAFPKSGRNSHAYREFLGKESGTDAAIVVTPDTLHFDTARELIESGIHTLVVKPLTPGLSESQSLCRLARERGVYGAVEFHKRWDEANLYLKKIIQDRRLGDLLYVLVEYSQKKIVPSEIFKGWAADTNVFQYLGVHYVDIIYHLTGARPVRVSAVGQKIWLKSQGIDTPDSIQAMVEWETSAGKKFQAVFTVNWIDPNVSSAMSGQKITFVGTAGRCSSDQKRRGIELTTDADGVQEPNPYFSEYFPVEPGHLSFRGYGYRSVRQFIEDAADIRSGKIRPADLEGVRPTFRDALISTAVVESVNQSLQSNGDWVDVPSPALEQAVRA